MKLWFHSLFMLFLSICICQNAISSLNLDQLSSDLNIALKMPSLEEAPLVIGDDKISPKLKPISFFALSPVYSLNRDSFLADNNFFYLPIRKFIQEKEFYLII